MAEHHWGTWRGGGGVGWVPGNVLGWGFRGTLPWGWGQPAVGLLAASPPRPLPAPKLSLVLAGGTMGPLASPSLHPKIPTPQYLGEAFLHCGVTQARGRDNRGSHPPPPHPRAWRRGKALAGMGPRELSPTAGSHRAQHRARDPPAAQDGGEGQGAGCFGGAGDRDRQRGPCMRPAGAGGWPGRLSPMEGLGLAGGN